MELREMSATGENQEKDVTLNEETADVKLGESVELEAETTNSEVDNTVVDEEEAENVKVKYSLKSKAELVELLATLLDKPVESIREELSQIKIAFYAIRKTEIEKEKEEFLAKGNEEAAFAVKDDADENKFKELLNQLKEKRAEFNSNQEALRAKNLERKQEIISELNSIVAEPDNINKEYNHFQQLQQEFKTVGEVPAANVTELWKSYQLATEKFYDLLKMNKELRDYDFKKNLEIKEQLCAEATALDLNEDIIESFKALQALHQTWRETGPVAKELREELWSKFKDASSAINKKYQNFFEERKAKEKENEDAKAAICDKIEAIDVATLKTFQAWDAATKQIIAMQEEWKTLGFASRKVNTALFARFRKACDEFFGKKAEHFKEIKNEFTVNLQKKEALCEKAEALKDSTDWKKTADILVSLQKEWKTIGPVAKKNSDAVWKRFIAACDSFFEAKNKQTNDLKKGEHENLKLKKEVIAQLSTTLEGEKDKAAADSVRKLMKQWQEIGHVPFKEKDKVYAEYKALIDEAFDKLDMKGMRANLANYEETISKMSDKDKVYREREYLVRSYEQKRSELKTFENNMGFFNATSKNGNSMLKEMEHRIQKIKDELTVIEKKIKLIDSARENA